MKYMKYKIYKIAWANYDNKNIFKQLSDHMPMA